MKYNYDKVKYELNHLYSIPSHPQKATLQGNLQFFTTFNYCNFIATSFTVCCYWEIPESQPHAVL